MTKDSLRDMTSKMGISYRKNKGIRIANDAFVFIYRSNVTLLFFKFFIAIV
jgi:flagellar basal body P-ring protein FlgI